MLKVATTAQTCIQTQTSLGTWINNIYRFLYLANNKSENANIVGIVGRPTSVNQPFFNRLTVKREAIMDNMPGVTREPGITGMLNGAEILHYN